MITKSITQVLKIKKISKKMKDRAKPQDIQNLTRASLTEVLITTTPIFHQDMNSCFSKKEAHPLCLRGLIAIRKAKHLKERFRALICMKRKIYSNMNLL